MPLCSLWRHCFAPTAPHRFAFINNAAEIRHHTHKKKKKQNPTEYVLFLNLKCKSTVILNDGRSSIPFLHYWQPVTLGKKPAIVLIIMSADGLSSLDSGTSATTVTNRFGSRTCSKPTIAGVKNYICLTGGHNAFYSVKPCKTKNMKPECRRVIFWLISSLWDIKQWRPFVNDISKYILAWKMLFDTCFMTNCFLEVQLTMSWLWLWFWAHGKALRELMMARFTGLFTSVS